jgi:CheY-like chemotaxis protein
VAPRILVIDDEPAYTRLVRLILTRTCGYEVLEVNDATKAVAAAAEFQPDLILLDIVMPGLDGGEVANRIRRSPGLGDVPIVFVSGISLSDVNNHGISGSFPFHAKPFQMENLLSCISQNLRRAAPAMG